MADDGWWTADDGKRKNNMSTPQWGGHNTHLDSAFPAMQVLNSSTEQSTFKKILMALNCFNDYSFQSENQIHYTKF